MVDEYEMHDPRGAKAAEASKGRRRLDNAHLVLRLLSSVSNQAPCSPIRL